MSRKLPALVVGEWADRDGLHGQVLGLNKDVRAVILGTLRHDLSGQLYVVKMGVSWRQCRPYTPSEDELAEYMLAELGT
jgi:hypothetical protein